MKKILNIALFFIGIIVFITITICASLYNIYFHAFYGDLKAYCKNLWLAFDQLANASLGNNRDVTISGTIGYKMKNNKANKVETFIGNLLNKADLNHTNRAIEEDENNEYKI